MRLYALCDQDMLDKNGLSLDKYINIELFSIEIKMQILHL